MSKRMVDLKVADGKVTSINGYEVGGSGGGSGGGNIVVTSAQNTSNYKNNVTPRWNGGHALQANTQYEVGAQVQVYYNAMFDDKRIGSNQILIPYSISPSISADRNRLQFGDVVLVLTDVTASVSSYYSNITNQEYRFQIENYLTYTIVKAGTTGNDITLPSTGFSATARYLVCTIEPASA